MKSGIMTWCGTTLKKLCQTARVTEDAEKKKRTVKIGGIGNADGKRYVLHFVHKDTVDGDVRVTIVGSNQAGFTIAFAKDSETVIDAEFKAQPMDKEGTLILYEEDMDFVFRAVIECVEESVISSMLYAKTVAGRAGNRRESLAERLFPGM